MKIHNLAARNAPKMLMVLQTAVIPAGLAGPFDLKSSPNLGQSQQGAVNGVQRDAVNILPHHFVDFLGGWMCISADEGLIYRHPLRRNPKALLTASGFKFCYLFFQIKLVFVRMHFKHFYLIEETF